MTNAGLFFGRGTTVGVLLVSMSINYKARVIRVVGSLDRGGPYIAFAMCILSLLTRLSFVGLMLTEFIIAAIKNPNAGMKNAVFIPLYVVFSIAWGLFSYTFVRGRDDDDDESDMGARLCIFETIRRTIFLMFYVHVRLHHFRVGQCL